MIIQKKFNTVGIIPARYSSTRFPGKPLELLGEMPIIQHVYKTASQVLKWIYIATDDQKIFDTVQEFGGNVVMTSESHRSGTDRCAEALDIIESETSVNFDVVINVQGDEPFIQAKQIRQLEQLFEDPESQITTLIKKISKNEDIFDPNKPKVVTDNAGFALLFSRSPIPFLRGVPSGEWPGNYVFFKHIGIYGYRSGILRELTKLNPSDIEMAESLEQLRWLSNGYRIKTDITDHESIGIDTPADLEKARFLLKDKKVK